MLTPFIVLAEAAAEVAHETAAEPSGIAKLGLNPLNLLLQMVTVVLLLLILRKYAFAPIVAALEERRQTIEDGIRLGREMEAAQAEAQEAIAKELYAAREQADQVLADARTEAESVRKFAQQAADSQAEQIIAEAKGRVERDMQRARERLTDEMLGLVADATEVIIDEKLDQTKDARLIQKALQGARQ